MAGPSPRDMGQQLALQLLAAFGNSPNPDSDAAEALAHAQLWLCNMRKAGLITSAGVGLGGVGVGLGMTTPGMQMPSHMMPQPMVSPLMPSMMAPTAGHGYGHTSPYEHGSETKGGRIRNATGVNFNDWRDRPSEFLREYGDPAAVNGSGARPGAGVNGNWECEGCGNINFPRRSNCLRCHTTRSEAGEAIVREYVRKVIERYNANV